MSDRALLFLFSIVVLIGSLGATAWLLISGQAGSVDGLFLLMTCLLVALAFALYIGFMVGQARERAAAPVAHTAAKAAPAAAPPAKPTPVA